MAFAIIYNTMTHETLRIAPGVQSENDIALNADEAVVLKQQAGVIPKLIDVDENGNIKRFVPEPTPEEIKAKKIKKIEHAIQVMLDNKALEYGYDNIVSACSYAAFDNPFQTEGQAFIAWRGSVWKYCYDQLAAIEAGNRDEPTLDEFLQELPQYTPPS
jgi:hypothetical protein